MMTILIVIAVLFLIVCLAAVLSVRVVQQYESGVVFRLGKVQDPPRGPGLTLLRPVVDRMTKVNRQVMTLSVPAQDCISRDNVSVRVDAVVYFRVVDAVKAAVNVQDYQFAISQLAQTSLRSVIGRAELDDLLSNREKLGAELTEIIDAPSEQPWGVKVERVEVKDVTLPESMKRSMSRQAEKNSTLVMPFPVELLRYLERATNHDVHDLKPGLPTPEPLDEAPAPSNGNHPAGSVS
jgi:regulator of protease activity HflC (stomatin/prohibitin superfamily)